MTAPPFAVTAEATFDASVSPSGVSAVTLKKCVPAVSEPPLDWRAPRLPGLTGKKYVRLNWPSVASTTSCWISFMAGRLRPVSEVDVSSAQSSPSCARSRR
jgi:hypothetical protein